jgi:glycosyltransferase involved in cell wall biosynthesis
LFVPNSDPVAFADGIMQVLGDPAGSDRMGEIGMARVEKDHSWQRQSEHLLDAYSFVLAGQR